MESDQTQRRACQERGRLNGAEEGLAGDEGMKVEKEQDEFLVGDEEGKNGNEVNDELIEEESEEEQDERFAGETEARSGPDEGLPGNEGMEVEKKQDEGMAGEAEDKIRNEKSDELIESESEEEQDEDLTKDKIGNEVTDELIESEPEEEGDVGSAGEPEEISGAEEDVAGDGVMSTIVKEQDVGSASLYDFLAGDEGVEIEEHDERLAREQLRQIGNNSNGEGIEPEQESQGEAKYDSALDVGIEQEGPSNGESGSEESNEDLESEDETFCMSEEGLHEEGEYTGIEGEVEAQRGSEVPVLEDDGRRRYRLVERLRFYSSDLSANEEDGPDRGQ